MMTLKQLYIRTSGDRRQKAMYVKVSARKAGHISEGMYKGLGFVAARTYSVRAVNSQGRLVRNENPQHYVSMIIFLDRKLHVHVACSCADNCFRWEVANTNKNAAQIEYSNGEWPDVTNPNGKVGLCKHLVALYESVRTQLPE